MTEVDDEIPGLLAEISVMAPPRSLNDRVTLAAMTARPGGQAIASLGGGVRVNRAAAFVQTVDDFKSVLALSDGTAIVEPYGWSVTQLVAHLLDVDLYFGRQLGLWDHAIDESLEDDHLAMTESAVRAAVKADFTETVSKWADVSHAVCNHVASLDAGQLDKRIKYHMLDVRVAGALAVRVFEIWTHLEDLCRSLRRDPPLMDAGRMQLLTRAAVGSIPLGLLLANLDGGGHTARIVLTGSGGGVWNQPLQLGAEAGEPAVTIVADALQFCRLAAQRITPADLHAEVEGSMDLALTVLLGASAFAA